MAVKQTILLKSLFILGLVVSSSMTSVTFASSEQAWNKHDQEIKTACIKASQLKNAKPISNVMLFDDRVGYSSLLIQGKYPQAHMKNKMGQELCLWNKTSKKAYVTEANMKVR
ncbi:hypothetical protein [Acinetobacter tjernbergiae]|uniref:Uncharacterized protein n=1 Tax=Acinetobacter tjernbergiae DSM 14971 = CIP 107465 TaxID=1120928 RepID=V2UZF9_9GAMM|nr:hypothetical protein [Acinetobacter tjernbergiae]ESK54050.1 hypothetical protein F990_03006 [Acinetobacter tjernbergiae DSM 14971 = CIP 107465]